MRATAAIGMAGIIAISIASNSRGEAAVQTGLRPVFHHTEKRTEGHLFITVLAYQLVQTIRRKLEAAGETISWSRLREILSVQQRVTATFRQRDARTLHVRKATVAEPGLRKIYDVLAIDPALGGVRKLIV
jgi:hypothetical protein